MAFPDGVAGGLYAELIESQLQQERNRKASLEQRGLALVTAAGTLVTLIFAFGAFVHGSGGRSLPPVSIGLLVGALVFFVVAASAGVLSNEPASYLEVDEQELNRLTTDTIWSWTNRVVAGRRVAEVKVRMITRARTQNDAKASRLQAAVASLIVAIVLLAATVATAVIIGQ